jgi:adenylyl- and sulfurtransferase ThiI
MSTDMIIVFFGELSTKGKNIMDFIRLLGHNIRMLYGPSNASALKSRKITSMSFSMARTTRMSKPR